MSYDDVEDARLYDVQNEWGPSDEFYLGLVMAAADVLDVGCGTGTLLKRARRDGHRGRLDLDRFLAAAGLEVETYHGDWARGPLTDTSPEIVTIARRSAG